MIKQLHIIAFTHRNMDVSNIGTLHISADIQTSRFEILKNKLKIQEIVFLSTCNRVEYIFNSNEALSIEFITQFFQELYPEMSNEQVDFYVNSAELYHRMDAVEHLLKVSSSIDSLVVGEREIITQVRQAFETARENKLSGDNLRLLMRHTIETAKKIYTETKISLKPVSIVSIAHQHLQQLSIPENPRVLVIGSGVTNTAMTRFLKENGITDFTIFNRTLSNAEKLATELGGKAFPLSELTNFSKGFDILLSCTGAEEIIVSKEMYENLLQGEKEQKITIDLALPNDISTEINANFLTQSISIQTLQQISEKHLNERSKEIVEVEKIIETAKKEFIHLAKTRAIEVAMRPVPQMVKDIRATAFNEVFKNDIEQLDDSSKETLEKVVAYMEKKYMSMPMIMAKEIMFKS